MIRGIVTCAALTVLAGCQTAATATDDNRVAASWGKAGFRCAGGQTGTVLTADYAAQGESLVVIAQGGRMLAYGRSGQTAAWDSLFDDQPSTYVPTADGFALADAAGRTVLGPCRLTSPG